MRRLASWLGRCALALVCAGCLVAGSSAEELWEFSPYHIRLWLNFAPRPELTPALYDEITRYLAQRADIVYGATWDLKFEETPVEFRTESAIRLESVDVNQIAERARLTTLKRPKRAAP